MGVLATTGLLTAGTWFVANDTTGGGDKGALYASLASVAVALIGGTVAVLTNRNRADEHPGVRYIDPPSSNALPAAMAELYEHVKDELEGMKVERDVWRRRAIQAGWDE